MQKLKKIEADLNVVLFKSIILLIFNDFLQTSSFIQNSHFCLTLCEAHCLNLFLDCSSPGGLRSTLLSFPVRIPSKRHPCDSIVRNSKNISYNRLHLKLN